MQTYLEVNCQDITIKKDNDSIVIKVKATLRKQTQNYPNKIHIVNEQELAQKEAIYHQLFKSEVVLPPPPPQPVPIIEQPQRVQSNGSIFQKKQVSNSPNRQHIVEQRRNNPSEFGSQNIFSRGSARQSHQQSNNSRSQQSPFQSSNGRNNIFSAQPSSQQNNTSRNSIFNSNNNRANSVSSHSSQNNSNLFMMSNSQQNQPSLFANPPPTGPNNNKRNARKPGPQRIG